MDIAATSLFVQQQAYGQLATGQSMLKQNANSEKQTAAILEKAITAAASSDGSRGTNLDILV